jgi:hypothetical protein
MGLMDWFKSLAAGKSANESDVRKAEITSPEGSVVAGLDFKTAIDAHMKWKIRLERCLEGGNEENLQVDVVSRDDQCALGKWIHGLGGERFGDLPEFQQMQVEHARFHLCAADVLTCCLAGDREGASNKLRSGDYTRASERVKLFLARLYIQVKQ